MMLLIVLIENKIEYYVSITKYTNRQITSNVKYISWRSKQSYVQASKATGASGATEASVTSVTTVQGKRR